MFTGHAPLNVENPEGHTPEASPNSRIQANPELQPGCSRRALVTLQDTRSPSPSKPSATKPPILSASIQIWKAPISELDPCEPLSTKTLPRWTFGHAWSAVAAPTEGLHRERAGIQEFEGSTRASHHFLQERLPWSSPQRMDMRSMQNFEKYRVKVWGKGGGGGSRSILSFTEGSLC